MWKTYKFSRLICLMRCHFHCQCLCSQPKWVRCERLNRKRLETKLEYSIKTLFITKFVRLECLTCASRIPIIKKSMRSTYQSIRSQFNVTTVGNCGGGRWWKCCIFYFSNSCVWVAWHWHLSDGYHVCHLCACVCLTCIFSTKKK